ncbi:2-dehydropantoate 2-reductase (Ketopantoate reductase) (KPA reductase) (KPR) [Mortierella sp. AM989]|nr:2-dehydropantoate 2-reductase (Ketopantoate reductase) (KPA reductase) (KPR) [Mortierella sp. AM989]
MPKAAIQYTVPRFHILGPGGIGSLFGYYFHAHNIPFTFFQRKAPPPTPLLHVLNNSNTSGEEESSVIKTNKIYNSYPPTTLKYMNLTSLDYKSVEPQPIDGVDWEPLYPVIDKELFRYDPVYNELSRSPIHHLLVTTKTYQTVDAISKIRHRLRPWTTIVLMQNGMGVREEICEAMGWADEKERPNFVQGIITHGAQKVDDTIVHTGKGTVYLSPVADSFSGATSTSGRESERENDKDEDEDDDDDDDPASSLSATLSAQESSKPSIDQIFSRRKQGSPYAKLLNPSRMNLNTPYPYKSPAPFYAPYTDAPFSSFYTPPESPAHLRALRTRSLFETLETFQRLEHAMKLRILMPKTLLALQLSKLVVNSCVNPVATLLESTNGGLLDPETEDAHQAVKDLLKESQLILSQSREYQDLGEGIQKEHLTLETLTKTTIDILKATRQNQCSTLQDYLKGSQQCEIEYMNGYLIKMAERDRTPGTKAESVAPFNRMVTEKVKEKFATLRNIT